MRSLSLMALVLALSSCSWIPGSVVRVALPDSAVDRWGQTTALPSFPQGLRVEVVKADAFPPPDLIWWTGSSAETEEDALAANREVEALATRDGLGAGWFAPEGPRVLPLAWSPWAWFEAGSGTALPDPSDEDRRVLGWFQAWTEGPSLAATEVKSPLGREGSRVWMPWSAWQKAGLRPLPSDRVAARVQGFWWNSRGWNPGRVPELLAFLWSAPAQAVWRQDGWLSANQGPWPGAPAQGVLLVP